MNVLPSIFDVTFRQVGTGNNTHVETMYDGKLIGDVQTSEKKSQLRYAYHDVFHFAWLTFKGESKVVENLFAIGKLDIALPKNAKRDNFKSREFEEFASNILMSDMRDQYIKEEKPQEELFVTLNGMEKYCNMPESSEKELSDIISQTDENVFYLMQNHGGTLRFDMNRKLIYPLPR